VWLLGAGSFPVVGGSGDVFRYLSEIIVVSRGLA